MWKLTLGERKTKLETFEAFIRGAISSKNKFERKKTNKSFG